VIPLGELEGFRPHGTRALYAITGGGEIQVAAMTPLSGRDDRFLLRRRVERLSAVIDEMPDRPHGPTRTGWRPLGLVAVGAALMPLVSLALG
jgi:hypothetical protein